MNVLNNVPIKYFSANSLSSNCLNLAKLFAVSTNPIAPNCPINPNISIISLSNTPIRNPIFASFVSLISPVFSDMHWKSSETKIPAGFQHIRKNIFINAIAL